jgi:hypothetical protein
MVSGSNALIAGDVPAADPIGKVRVRRSGLDVTSAFQPEAGPCLRRARRRLRVVLRNVSGPTRQDEQT